jgi:hypothetical protein
MVVGSERIDASFRKRLGFAKALSAIARRSMNLTEPPISQTERLCHLELFASICMHFITTYSSSLAVRSDASPTRFRVPH